MARDVVELDGLYLVRLPERPWALASDVTGAKEAGWQVVDLGAYGAVVEAAKEYQDAERAMYGALVSHAAGLPDRRREMHDAEEQARQKLREALARLYAGSSEDSETPTPKEVNHE